MTADEFLQRMLRYEGPDTPRYSLICAADFFVQRRHHHESAVGPCLELAQHIAKFCKINEPAPRQAQPSHVFPTPGELITSDLLVQKIRPYVERLRQELFGSPEPPFASYEAAVEWLVRTGREEREHWQAESPPPPPAFQGINAEFVMWETSPEDDGQSDQRPKVNVWMDAAYQRREEAELLADPWWHASFTRRAIPYKASEDLSPEFIERWDSITIFDADSPLGRLERGAHEIAATTGFSTLSVVAYVLADVQPSRLSMKLNYENIRTIIRGAGPLTVQRPYENQIEYQRAIIEIYDLENIRADDFEALYRYLRGAVKRSRSKQFTARDRLLLDVVKRLGGVPSKGRMHFWERVCQTCNRESGAKLYKDGHGPRVEYGRLMKRLSHSLPVQRVDHSVPAEKRRIPKPRHRR
jgi:hypothetical protein